MWNGTGFVVFWRGSPGTYVDETLCYVESTGHCSVFTVNAVDG